MTQKPVNTCFIGYYFPMPDPNHTPDPRATQPAPAALAPIRIGEHPALDFANTLAAPAEVLLDFLATPAALLDWLAGTPELADAHALAQQAGARGELDAALAAVQALREAWRGALPRLADAEARATLQETLNAWLAAGRGHWQLIAQDGALRLLYVTAYTGPDSVAAAIAAVLAGLLAEVPAVEVRKCENPACVLWFRDTSKRGNRRWCSMAACGNRAKAAAHRRRLRAGDGGE